jgi:hypothetical protein
LPAKSHIFSQFDNVNTLLLSQLSTPPGPVFVAQFLGNQVYISFVFLLLSPHPLTGSLLAPFAIYHSHTLPELQLLATCSIFLAIVIHSLFVIKCPHIALQAFIACS